jgi:hypothetical protein
MQKFSVWYDIMLLCGWPPPTAPPMTPAASGCGVAAPAGCL